MSGKYALIIGNTEYADPGLAQLTAPGKDASEFARVLDSPDLCAFDDVIILFNEEASRVSEMIDHFFSLKKPDDLLVLYFSGHGVRDEYGSLYLAVRNTNRSRLRSTAIKSDFIREAMDQCRSRRQVLILDCCNSGAFAQGTKAEIGGSVGTAKAFEGSGYGRVILTASDATQFAWEGDKIIGGDAINSLFTHFLVKGLEGEADWNGDGNITIDELYDYVYGQIVNLTPKQTPGKWSYREQGEIILRQYVSDKEKGTQTGNLRRELVEQAKRFHTKQERLLEEKADLEERLGKEERGAGKMTIAERHIASPPSTFRGTEQSPRNWVLTAGIFAALCVLAFGALWIGYRIISVLNASPAQSATDVPTLQPPTLDTAVPNIAPTTFPEITRTTIPQDIFSEYLNDFQIILTDNFDDPLGSGWYFYSGGIKDGVLEIPGTENWGGALRSRKFREGEGVIIDFRYSSGSVFEVFFDHGEFDTDPYRRFGIYIRNNRVGLNEYTGGNDIGGADLSGNFSPQPEGTSTLLIAILPDGEFLVVVWNPSNPAETVDYREQFDQSWAGLNWNFFMQANRGIIQFDNFREIKFSGAK
jgi:uncharacterized caspase-like protein